MLEFLLVGTLWFWIVLAATLVGMLVALELENGWLATGITIVTVGLLCWANNVAPQAWVAQHPIGTLGLGLGWFIAGAVWGAVKWYFWLLRKRDRLIGRGLLKDGVATQEFHFDERYVKKGESFVPQVRDHKALVIMWMTYWPFSMVWTLINDPVRRAWDWLYARIGEKLQDIANKVFARAGA